MSPLLDPVSLDGDGVGVGTATGVSFVGSCVGCPDGFTVIAGWDTGG